MNTCPCYHALVILPVVWQRIDRDTSASGPWCWGGGGFDHLSRQVRTVSLARKGAGRTHGTTPSAKTVSGQRGGSQRAYLELRVSSPSCRFSAAISPSTSSCHPLSIIFCHPGALFFFWFFGCGRGELEVVVAVGKDSGRILSPATKQLKKPADVWFRGTSRKFYQPSSLLILGARASQHPPCMFSDLLSQDCSLQTLSPLLHGNLGDHGPFATSLLAIFTTARTIRMWTHTGRTPPESRRVSGTPVHLQLGPYIHCAYDYSPTRLHQETGVWY